MKAPKQLKQKKNRGQATQLNAKFDQNVSK